MSKVRRVLLELMVWTVLSVPVAILVGKVLRGPPEPKARQVPVDRPVRLVPLGRRGHPVYQDRLAT